MTKKKKKKKKRKYKPLEFPGSLVVKDPELSLLGSGHCCVAGSVLCLGTSTCHGCNLSKKISLYFRQQCEIS